MYYINLTNFINFIENYQYPTQVYYRDIETPIRSMVKLSLSLFVYGNKHRLYLISFNSTLHWILKMPDSNEISFDASHHTSYDSIIVYLSGLYKKSGT